jgi:hypothetical protein
MFRRFGHPQMFTFTVGCTVHPLYWPVFTVGIFCVVGLITMGFNDVPFWRIDPLLGKDLETNNETTAVAMQQIGNTHFYNNRVIVVFTIRGLKALYLCKIYGCVSYIAR